MADVTGAMLTTNVLSDQLAIDLGDRISELEPNWQVLSVFTRAADKRATEATKFLKNLESWMGFLIERHSDGLRPLRSIGAVVMRSFKIQTLLPVASGSRRRCRWTTK